MSENDQRPDMLYVGTYTAPHCAPGENTPSEAEGIYVFHRFNDGHLELVQTVSAENPSFLAMSPDRRTLYAASELGEDAVGQPLGEVLAFRCDEHTGRLDALNSQRTNGTWPCHLSATSDGKHLLAANYGSGGFVVFPLEASGQIGAMVDQREYSGRGPERARQGQSHPHFIAEEPALGLILGADLGMDQVRLWTRDSSDGHLVPNKHEAIQTAGGTGPRHLVVHPEYNCLLVLNELSSSIDVFSLPIGVEQGPIWRQSISTLPPDSAFGRPAFDPSNPGFVEEGSNTTAEIRLHPSGRFGYATNRGMNTVATFAFNETSHLLEPLGWTPTLGERPRGMNISPDGRFLYVGNQGSNNIVVFSIDEATGSLSDPLFDIPCPTPVDFAF